MKKILIFFLTLIFITRLGYCGIDFDGADDRFVVNSNTSIDNIFDGGGTIAFWATIEDFTGVTRRLIGKTFDAWVLYLYDSGTEKRITWEVKFSTTSGVWLYTNKITDTNWHHIALTYNADATTNDPIFYVDGTAQTKTSETTPSGTRGDDSTFNLDIANSAAGTAALDGKMNEIGLWTVILTQAEITILAASKIKGMPLQIQPTNLKGYWPMDEGTHGNSADLDTCYDWSGNGNNGNPDNGANNTGLTWLAETILGYPEQIIGAF